MRDGFGVKAPNASRHALAWSEMGVLVAVACCIAELIFFNLSEAVPVALLFSNCIVCIAPSWLLGEIGIPSPGSEAACPPTSHHPVTNPLTTQRIQPEQ